MTNTTFYFSEKDIREFKYYLQERENAQATMEKYIRDVRNFMEYVGKDRKVDKDVDKTLEREEFLRLVRTARSQGKEPFQHLEGNEENLRAGRSQT